MKLKPNVSYNCNCRKLENIDDNIPNINLSLPQKKTTQIITFYSKNKKDKNKKLF
jgi:hypothetical protein